MSMTKSLRHVEIVQSPNEVAPIEIRISETDGRITERVLLTIPEALQLITRLAEAVEVEVKNGT